MKTRTIASLRTGESGTIVATQGPDQARYKPLGLCEGQRVEVLRRGNPIVVRVVGARIGMCRQLAESILVDDAAPASVA